MKAMQRILQCLLLLQMINYGLAQGNKFIPKVISKTEAPPPTSPPTIAVTEQLVWGIRLWQVIGCFAIGTVIFVVICCCLCDYRIPQTKSTKVKKRKNKEEDDSDDDKSWVTEPDTMRRRADSVSMASDAGSLFSIPSMKSGASQMSLIKKGQSGRRNNSDEGQDNSSYEPEDNASSDGRKKESRPNSRSQGSADERQTHHEPKVNGTQNVQRSHDRRRSSGSIPDHKLANEIIRRLSESRDHSENKLANEVIRKFSESRGQLDNKLANEVMRQTSESSGHSSVANGSVRNAESA